MSQLGRTLFIVNPYAKSGKGRLAIPYIERAGGGVLDFEIAVTQDENHAFELARNARDFDSIVSVGGDGNAHYVANGILSRDESDRPAFSLLPIGSGNDYARTLGIATDLPKALASIINGKRCLIDVGSCNDEYFLESASFGIDAAIAAKTTELRKTTNSSGILLYLQAGFEVIGKHFDSLHAKCVYDDSQLIEQESLIFSATIGSTYGGGFIIAPNADPCDGLLNICTADPVSKLKALLIFICATRGSHTGFKAIHLSECSHLVIDFETEPPAQCDGESKRGKHFDLSIIPLGLEVVVPQQSALTVSSSKDLSSNRGKI